MELLERGAETELVLPRTVAERARSEHSDKFEAALQSPLCDLYLHVGAIEVGLTLTDCQGFIGAYDDQGRLRACVNSTNPALQGWTGRLYERYRDRSCLLTADTIAPEQGSGTCGGSLRSSR